MEEKAGGAGSWWSDLRKGGWGTLWLSSCVYWSVLGSPKLYQLCMVCLANLSLSICTVITSFWNFITFLLPSQFCSNFYLYAHISILLLLLSEQLVIKLGFHLNRNHLCYYVTSGQDLFSGCLTKTKFS